MNIRSNIVCSEYNIDLKDKVVMSEQQCSVLTMNTGKTDNVEPMTEKTLTDLIRNNQLDLIRMGSASVQGFATPLIITAAHIHNEAYCTGSEVTGSEWVIPNKETEEKILNGNESNYIHMCISLKVPDYKVLVLCEVRKEYWSDGSYKRKFYPLTYSQLKRMPE